MKDNEYSIDSGTQRQTGDRRLLWSQEDCSEARKIAPEPGRLPRSQEIDINDPVSLILPHIDPTQISLVERHTDNCRPRPTSARKPSSTAFEQTQISDVQFSTYTDNEIESHENAVLHITSGNDLCLVVMNIRESISSKAARPKSDSVSLAYQKCAVPAPRKSRSVGSKATHSGAYSYNMHAKVVPKESAISGWSNTEAAYQISSSVIGKRRRPEKEAEQCEKTKTFDFLTGEHRKLQSDDHILDEVTSTEDCCCFVLSLT